MPQFRFAHIGLLLAALGLNTAPALFGVAAPAYAADALRPEIGKPLQAAGQLYKAKKYKEALAEIRKADAVSGKTPNEVYTIERMRASVAQAAGEPMTAAKSYEALIDSGKVPASEKLTYIQALVSMYYEARDYPKTITWLNRYFKEGGTDPKMRELLNQTYFLSGDYAKAGKEAQAEVQAAEKAGRTPAETQLQMWANTASRTGDKAEYLRAIEKLVTYYPKKDYWIDLLNRVQSKPGYSSRLELDVFRIKFALGLLSKADEYMEMAQLDLQGGFANEAVKVLDQGYKTNVLGTGAQADRQKRLRDLALKTQADQVKNQAQTEAEADKNPDGTALIDAGYALIAGGQASQGVKLVDAGLKKGNFKRTDDAKLHAGEAYLLAGKKAQAIQTFKSVHGTDGTADLARYWIVVANHPSAG